MILADHNNTTAISLSVIYWYILGERQRISGNQTLKLCQSTKRTEASCINPGFFPKKKEKKPRNSF